MFAGGIQETSLRHCIQQTSLRHCIQQHMIVLRGLKLFNEDKNNLKLNGQTRPLQQFQQWDIAEWEFPPVLSK